MATFVEAEVIEILEDRRGLQKLRVSRDDAGRGELAYMLTEVLGNAEVGNRVVLNTTAVDLDLGTGGWHFVHWNLSRSSLRKPGSSHQMKMRYTSLQFDTAAAEESYELPASLVGMPVICCELLSQAAIAAAMYKHKHPGDRVVYVMTDQNSLPMAISDLVFAMCKKGLLDATVTAGQAFGGDYEVVNTLSGLGVAKLVCNADLVIVSPGPGSLGTGSRFGFSTLAIAASLDDAHWYGAEPILTLRYSDADHRHRHQGMSHHSLTILERSQRVTVAAPLGQEIPTMKQHDTLSVDTSMTKTALIECGLDVKTMGRSYEDDPLFFEYAAAAAVAASQINH